MTRDEAIEMLEEVRTIDDSMYQYNERYLQALNMAIEALEREPNIDMESEEIKNLQKRAYLEGFHEALRLVVSEEGVKVADAINNKAESEKESEK